jgi:hypothetical protein
MLFRIILRGRILPGPNLRGRLWLAAFSFAPISTATAPRNRRLVLSDCGGGKRRAGIGSLNKESLGRLPPEASVLVLGHLTLRCWSQRRTAAPLKPIPTETAVKRVSVLDIRLAVRMSFLSALIFGAQYANEARQLWPQSAITVCARPKEGRALLRPTHRADCRTSEALFSSSGCRSLHPS